MKTKLLFLAVAFLLLSCSNEKENELFDEMETSEVTTKAGYRKIAANLYLTNSMPVATRLNWEILSIDVIGENNIISSVEDDFVLTDFSGASNVGSGVTLDKEIIGSGYFLRLLSDRIERMDIHFYSLYSGTAANVDSDVSFDIRVDIRGNSSAGVLATTSYITSSSKDRNFTIPVDMSAVATQDDYFIEIYVNAIKPGELGIVIDMEGNIYTYRGFGNAGYWMTQNLRSTKNNLITLAESPSGGYYPVDRDHPEYGNHYTWNAATASQNRSTDNQGNTDHPQYQGICPEGWHLPSDKEWNELEQAIIANPREYSSTTSVQPWDPAWATSMPTYRGTHGNAMKSTIMIDDYETEGTSFPAIAGAGGFNALLAGNRFLGSRLNYGTIAFFWTSSSQRSDSAFYRHLHWASSQVYRSGKDRAEMLTVRCKKND